LRRDLFTIFIRREVLIRVSNEAVVIAVMSKTILISSNRTPGPNLTVGLGRLQTCKHMAAHAY
jgi:hypothetical protein